MDPPSLSSVIIIGAGASGLSAAKVLIEKGVEDVVILEASDRIGGRIRKQDFGGVAVELGPGWIVGVGGKKLNPAWELAEKLNLRTCLSDYSNTRFNIYDRSGNLIPSGVAADSYNKAVESAMEKLGKLEAEGGHLSISKLTEPCGLSTTPKTPIELAIDFTLHDFEMAEVEPIATFNDFGDKEFLVADERGYEYLLYKMAEDFLLTSDGKILDSRLKLNKVVRELKHSKRDGVAVLTEDGCVYRARYVILSVSIGVLQSNLISFTPPLPHMENAYSGSNILVVTLTNGESKRVEAQSEEDTLQEVMAVLRDMFGPNIPEATDILIPRWWTNSFQRGSYSNYPIISNHQVVRDIKAPVGCIFFTGEHTSEKYSGYVHGAYLTGIETATSLLKEMGRQEEERSTENKTSLTEQPLRESTQQNDAVTSLKCDVPRQLYVDGKHPKLNCDS